MSKPKPPAWSKKELAILHDIYPREGINGAADALADRSWKAIEQKAHKLSLRSPVVADAPQAKLQGADLEEAIRLREEQNWSFARIGATFGISESSACNAVLIALCPRKGFTPAQRDAHGRLTEEGLERVRLALRKGLKGVDIQLRLGVSAGCVAEQRRRYQRDLKERGKAALPPPGGGEAYSGVKLTKAKKQEVEDLFLQGLGTLKVSERSGASKTSCTRIRNRLIKKLKRQGQCLPGCDLEGTRHVQAESDRFVTAEQVHLLRAHLLDRVPVRRAALMLAIGGSTAYRIRDELKKELRLQGEELPPPVRPGRSKPVNSEKHWPPEGPTALYRFRGMLAEGPFAEAKAKWIADAKKDDLEKIEKRRAEAMRPKSFEEQLARVRAGKVAIAPAFARQHLEPKIITEERAAQ